MIVYTFLRDVVTDGMNRIRENNRQKNKNIF